MAELKQTAQAKILMSPIVTRKRGHQIVKHAYHQTAHFFISQNDHHLGYAINFDYVSSSPTPLLLKITNDSLCHCSFFLNLFFQSSLTNQHDHHYMYRSYGLYLVKHFVVALTNACTVKLTQLHSLIRFKWARVIVWPAGVKSQNT